VQSGGSIVLELHQLGDRTPRIPRQQWAAEEHGMRQARLRGFDILAW
jgi:hypothetical protein